MTQPDRIDLSVGELAAYLHLGTYHVAFVALRAHLDEPHLTRATESLADFAIAVSALEVGTVQRDALWETLHREGNALQEIRRVLGRGATKVASC